VYAPLVINLIQSTQGTNLKLSLVKEHATEQVKELLYYAFNPFYNYGLQTITYEKSTLPVVKDMHDEFISLLDLCRVSNINTHLRNVVTEFLNSCDQHSQTIYADIICKNLRLGIAATQLNKVFGNFIPTFECMLAKPIEEVNVIYPVLVQEKLDGVRCLIICDGASKKAFTRKGQPLELPHIFVELPNNLKVVLDGELLSKTNRQRTSGLVNKVLKGTASLLEQFPITFNIFDMIPLDEFKAQTSTIDNRTRLIHLELGLRPKDHINIVPTEVVDNDIQLKETYERFRIAGSEGIIVKCPTCFYQYKRSNHWLKVKAINSCTLTVIGVEEGTGKYKATLGAMICTSSDKLVKVNVGSGFTEDERGEYWELFHYGTLVGKQIEVIYNEVIQAEDGSYSLFLPRFGGIRIDKTEADSLATIQKEQR